MADSNGTKRPGLGRRFLEGLKERELWLARTIWREINTKEEAEHHILYGRRAAFFAILLHVVYVIHPPGDGEVEQFAFDALANPLHLAFLAAYVYLLADGHRSWRVMVGFALLFAIDSFIVLPATAGGSTLLQAIIALYVLRCFLIGIRAGRWLMRAGIPTRKTT
jgi:hypothetical protein